MAYVAVQQVLVDAASPAGTHRESSPRGDCHHTRADAFAHSQVGVHRYVAGVQACKQRVPRELLGHVVHRELLGHVALHRKRLRRIALHRELIVHVARLVH